MPAKKLSELAIAKLKIKELREAIDEIDDGIVQLFSKRLDLASDIASIKNGQGIPASDYERERDILSRAAASCEPDKAGYMRTLFSAMIEISKFYQKKS